MVEVFDMPASIRFWTETLGFEIVESAGPEGDMGWVWLRRGNAANVMLNTMYESSDRPAERDVARQKAHKDTCIYFGCPDVDGMYDELRSRGLDLKAPEIAPYGMKQLYLRDPDGYNICFQWAVAPE